MCVRERERARRKRASETRERESDDQAQRNNTQPHYLPLRTGTLFLTQAERVLNLPLYNGSFKSQTKPVFVGHSNTDVIVSVQYFYEKHVSMDTERTLQLDMSVLKVFYSGIKGVRLLWPSLRFVPTNCLFVRYVLH